MKELSIGEKAKRYDEALGRARALNNGEDVDIEAGTTTCEYIFPELKESNDEKIKTEIINFIYDKTDTYELREKSNSWLAWLEKQDVQKLQGISAFEVWKDMRLEVYQQASGNRHEPNCSDDSTKMFSITDIDEIFEKIAEKQCEQNHADKVEPKFHEEDWTVSNLDGKARRISEVHFDEYNSYYVVDGKCVNLEEYDRLHHLWTIQDAKDGDVLVHSSFMFDDFIFIYNSTSNLQAYCYYSSERNKFIIEDRGHHCPWNMQEVTPATKEQRETLFKAMHEASYEWDAEKKELKKIDENSSWSEEDEKYLDAIERLIIGSRHTGYSGVSRKDAVEWLKSLKERYTWQPSDEQIDILGMVLTNESMDDNITKILRELREQLKNLKGK